MSREKSRYASVSLPRGIVKAIDELIEELGYWPSRGAFVRQACLEKIREERRRLKELREATEITSRSEWGEGPHRGTSQGISPRETAGHEECPSAEAPQRR